MNLSEITDKELYDICQNVGARSIFFNESQLKPFTQDVFKSYSCSIDEFDKEILAEILARWFRIVLQPNEDAENWQAIREHEKNDFNEHLKD